MTKILLVDDHTVVLASLKLLFRIISDVEIVGTINDSREVIPFLENNEVDLIISDFHMPHFSGVDLALKVRNQFPNLKVILLTMAEDAPHIREAIIAGVNGYILKKSETEDIETAIIQVMKGKKYFSPEVIEELTNNYEEDLNNSTPNSLQNLTEREIEVLKLVVLEKSNSEIAEKLFVSLSTIESHRRNLFQKLNVKSAVGLTKYAITHGLIE
jgi:DNA-binding NarL/FixJ family response regulator